MIDVNVSVFGILMCCDESVLGLNLGHGYSIAKMKYEDIPVKDKISDGNGHLSTDYFGSRIIEPDGVYFMCIRKDAAFQINGIELSGHMQIITDENIMCAEKLSAYTGSEMDYLNEQVNLCRLFHAGNIGFRDVFFTYHHRVLGINNTFNNNSHNQTRNVIDNRRWHLCDDELSAANQWLSDYTGTPYSVLKSCIDMFSWGLEQIDPATGFEKYTTALEMVLLETDAQAKKQRLANRTSVLIGSDNTEITAIHQKMLSYYRYRSESLHEGDDSNISDAELKELEEITRRVLKKVLIRCKAEITNEPCITWGGIKDRIINDLISHVSSLKSTGVLPS